MGLICHILTTIAGICLGVSLSGRYKTISKEKIKNMLTDKNKQFLSLHFKHDFLKIISDLSNSPREGTNFSYQASIFCPDHLNIDFCRKVFIDYFESLGYTSTLNNSSNHFIEFILT